MFLVFTVNIKFHYFYFDVKKQCLGNLFATTFVYIYWYIQLRNYELDCN